MVTKIDFVIMTILKTVYLAHSGQGNIEFSRFRYYLIPCLIKRGTCSCHLSQILVTGKNVITKQQKNFSVLHNTNKFLRDLLL